MDGPFTLLAVGDMHLGRRPARLPDDLARTGLHADALGPAAAWNAVVQHALAERVDAVALAGDVVEAADDFFEAYTLLDRGIRTLLAAGIPVLAVAGNHDVTVLPRLADAIPGFRLLGRDGRWETAVLARDGRPAARVLGWSFPRQQVADDPLATLPGLDGPAVPAVGLLHCDLDAGASRYAPVRRTALERVPVQAWLLGHVHAPGPLVGPRPIGYLGSLVGLDARDRGPRGAWRVAVEPGRVTVEHIPLAPLRWEVATVDVAALPDAEALEGAVVEALERLHAGLAASPRAVGVDVHLAGEHRLGRSLGDAVVRLDLAALRPERDGTLYFVHRLVDDSRHACDLTALATAGDPPGLLARRLLVLDGPDGPERRRLLAAGREALERERTRAVYQRLAVRPPDDATVAAWMRRAGRHALVALLAQREAPR